MAWPPIKEWRTLWDPHRRGQGPRLAGVTKTGSFYEADSHYISCTLFLSHQRVIQLEEVIYQDILATILGTYLIYMVLFASLSPSRSYC